MSDKSGANLANSNPPKSNPPKINPPKSNQPSDQKNLGDLAGVNQKPLRILVAEDEALIRLDLVEMLRESGYEVVGQAANGKEAVEIAESLRPDLAILDVKMPEMDGITAAESIIEIAPVIMLTAFSQKDLVERARDVGVMAYVVKPFTIGDLLPAIEIAFSRYQQMKLLRSEISDLAERLETRKTIDRAKGILMKALALSEAEAFSWIQRTAMDRRISMKDVANAVISPEAAGDIFAN